MHFLTPIAPVPTCDQRLPIKRIVAPTLDDACSPFRSVPYAKLLVQRHDSFAFRDYSVLPLRYALIKMHTPSVDHKIILRLRKPKYLCRTATIPTFLNI